MNESRPTTTGMEDSLPRRLAFYLPQFHRTIENDAAFDDGFSEWTSVASSRPLFPGHEQPILPGELGFYDLRVSETRQRQAHLASSYGISGFCIYHYWLHGERLLNRPLDDLLSSGVPEFPFCLLWANHAWKRRWYLPLDEVTFPIEYSEEDDRKHIRWLLTVFKDPRYIRVRGRPVFGIYLPHELPDPARTIEIWREEAERSGEAQPWLIGFEASHDPRDPGWNPVRVGFDAESEFFPHEAANLVDPDPEPEGTSSRYPNHVFDYAKVAAAFEGRPHPGWLRYPCVTPGWDNTPRRPEGQATILLGASPERYGQWLRNALERQAREEGSEGIVFINAWNEWAESAILEPDAIRGRARLEETRQVVLELGGALAPVLSPVPEGSREELTMHDVELWDRAVTLQRKLVGFNAFAERRLEELRAGYERELQELRSRNSSLVEVIERRGLIRDQPPPTEISPSGRSVHVDRGDRGADLYLDLLKKVLTRILFLDDRPRPDASAVRELRVLRGSGRDWPDEAETMIGTTRLDQLEAAVRTVIDEGIPGDLVEAGVWRGGASILMAGVLEALGDAGRRVFVADSFEGLPPPDEWSFPQDGFEDLSVYPELAVSLEEVRANFARYGLLGDRVVFVPGLFKNSLASVDTDEISVLRVDCDYYESTLQVLEALYSRVSPGGFVIIDDFLILEACRKAVNDFRAANSIEDVLVRIDDDAVFWRRSSSS